MSDEPVDRRTFIQTAAAGAALSVGLSAALSVPTAVLAQASAPAPERPKKAVKFDMVRVEGTILEKFQLLKRLGYDGVEISAPNNLDTAEVVAARDATNLPIHGVVDSVHWNRPLSDNDPAVRAQGLEGLQAALRAAKAYGATTVLLVPAVVKKDVSYQDAYQRSQDEIRRALPLAAELGIKIALENVWNHFLLSPLEMARYIDELDSAWIGAYFDVGNIVTYGWPEHWIRTLGRRVFKVDVKEFSRRMRDQEGNARGFNVELLEGDCDWPAVMRAFRDIQFAGWFTAEIPGGDETRLRAIAERMDRIFAS